MGSGPHTGTWIRGGATEHGGARAGCRNPAPAAVGGRAFGWEARCPGRGCWDAPQRTQRARGARERRPGGGRHGRCWWPSMPRGSRGQDLVIADDELSPGQFRTPEGRTGVRRTCASRPSRSPRAGSALAPAAPATKSRPWPSPVAPTPASPLCSTASPAATCSSRASCSPRWTPRSAGSATAAPPAPSPTPSVSSATCPTSSSTPSAPPRPGRSAAGPRPRPGSCRGGRGRGATIGGAAPPSQHPAERAGHRDGPGWNPVLAGARTRARGNGSRREARVPPGLRSPSGGDRRAHPVQHPRPFRHL